jgi:hypothetical protein
VFKAGHVIATLGLVLAFACAANVSVASAGTYEVAICHDPATGESAPTDGVSFPTAGAYALAGVAGSCGASGYIYASLDGVAGHGPNDLAAWRFQAPPGTTIVDALAYRAFSVGPVVPFAAPLVEFDGIAQSGAQQVLAFCAQSLGCAGAGTGPSDELAPANVVNFTGLSNLTALEGTAVCGGGQTCAPGAGALCPELGGDPCIASNLIYAMVVTLQDDTAPSASNVSGSLIAPGSLSGTVDVSFDATDAGSGVYSTSLSVDGATVASAPVDTAGGHCVPIDPPGSTPALRFAWTVPCQLSASGTLAFDTSALPDGAHSATVTVSDAAGNVATVWSGTIHTDNAPQGGSPQVYGSPQQGQTLIAATGSWSPAPTSYAYQWQRCAPSGTSCVAIPGATAAAYTLAAADDYHQLAVTVSASDADGSTSTMSSTSGIVADADGYTSAPPAPQLAAGSLPAISGTARVGSTLTAAPGEWSGAPLSYIYAWQSCDPYGLGCTAIPAADGQSYRLTGADEGLRVRVLVAASGPGGSTQAASEPSQLIAGAGGSSAPAAPAATSPPLASATQRPPNGLDACPHPALRVNIAGTARASVRYGQSAMLRGVLRCATQAVSGATLAVLIKPTAGTLGPLQRRVRTAADGSFSYRLPRGESRRITVSYRESDADSSPAATASVELLVTPELSLTITPARTTNGHTITFRGRVSGGEEPAAGLPLELEYLEGGHWMIYTIVEASARDGSFSYRYTFERTTQSITYTFRVALPVDGVPGYPFQPATSPPRSVHVDP